MPTGVAVNKKVPFGIGSNEFAGFSKYIEETGEALQVVGKMMGSQSLEDHWDGKGSLKERLEEEIADNVAAARFLSEANGLDNERIIARADKKHAKFWRWHNNIQQGRDPNDDG